MAMAITSPARRDLLLRRPVADLATPALLLRSHRAVADFATPPPIVVADLASPSILRHHALITPPSPLGFLSNLGGSPFSPPPLGATFNSNASHLLGAGAGSGRRGRVLARCSSKNTEGEKEDAFLFVLAFLIGVIFISYIGDSAAKTPAAILGDMRTHTRTAVIESIVQHLVNKVQKLAAGWMGRKE